ncbi:hypothetical protein [Bifidobacterium myosotis]|uniref:Uncharacterized protein n=1 Tax=Bifidobacterium myosotis TaxID=1630166 RepID=A0A5M9ZI49_9BIFI|nr:hypothetical protein [Bifidobacterium myosotis]KAA8827230.1 hypothetical protein EMO91_09270 [Bifidobacterium myosotis]
MSVATELIDRGYDPDMIRGMARRGVDLDQAMTFTEFASVIDDVLQHELEEYDSASADDSYVLYGGTIGNFKDDVKRGVLEAVMGRA